MVKSKALKWIEAGAKMVHTSFSEGEYLTSKNEVWMFEDEVPIEAGCSARLRDVSHYPDGWDFKKGSDPYTDICMNQYGCSLEEVTPSMRNKMKGVYFFLAYGGESLKLNEAIK